MRIDPKHLMIIAEISNADGFTEAASSLGTSQPPISRVVKMLDSGSASHSPAICEAFKHCPLVGQG